MAEIPTIKVKSGDSYAIINECDFEPTVHEKFDEQDEAKAPKKTAEPKPKSKGKAK